MRKLAPAWQHMCSSSPRRCGANISAMPTADRELPIVAQTGKLRLCTEFGVIEIEPGEICIIQRGMIFRVELVEGPARAYVCENYGGAFTLPGGGPDRVHWPSR